MNFNKVFVLGNLTRDPELRQTSGGQTVATFGVATNRIWNDAGGRRQTQAEFHNIVIWGRQAEVAKQYLAKGRLVFIEGRLATRTWQDQSGQKRNRTEIIAQNIQLGPRFNQGSEPRPAAASREQAPAPLPEVQLDDVGTPSSSPEDFGGELSRTANPPLAEKPDDDIKVEDIPF